MKPKLLTGRARIRDELDAAPDLSDEQLAYRLLRTLNVHGDAAAVLRPLVQDAFGFERRAETRGHEAAVFNGVPHRTLRIESVPSEPRTIKLTIQLLRSPLPEFRNVTWGEATREQMVEAKERLQRRAAGIQVTVTRLEKAIALLDETGADTLSDIPGVESRI